jgi:hypothetical protein
MCYSPPHEIVPFFWFAVFPAEPHESHELGLLLGLQTSDLFDLSLLPWRSKGFLGRGCLAAKLNSVAHPAM